MNNRENHISYILVITLLLSLFSCKEKKSTDILHYSCNETNNFCIVVKDTINLNNKLNSIENVFRTNKLTFLNNSNDWISFNQSEYFNIKIEVDNEVEYEIDTDLYSLDNYDEELVNDYLSKLTTDLNEVLLLDEFELLTLRRVHLPISWGIKNSYPPTSLNNVLSENDLYYLSDNFNL